MNSTGLSYPSTVGRILARVGYYRGMLLRWRSSLAFVAAACAVLPGCKPPNKARPVTVRIFRDLPAPYGQELDYRILDFQGTNPRLANGAAIYVGNLSTTDQPSAVNNLDDPAFDIVVLGSYSDAAKYPALLGELGHAVNVCAAVQACPADVPALVPSKLEGERAEAANKFVQFLATAKPAPAAANPPPPAQPQATPAQAGH